MQKRRTLFAHLLLLCALTTYAQTASIPGGNVRLDVAAVPSATARPQPPRLHQPVWLPGEDGMTFSWEALPAPMGCRPEYELQLFVLPERESAGRLSLQKPVFSAVTTETHFLYGQQLPPLRPGSRYAVAVHARLVYSDRTEVLDGSANALVFTYIPECTPPAKVKVDGIGTDNFRVSWSGIPATEGGYRYVVRYRDQTKKNPVWRELLVQAGNEVEIYGLRSEGIYEVEVRKICPPQDGYPESFSDWAGVKDIGLPAPKSISLPAFNCGDQFSPPVCDTPYVRSGSFDTLYIGGFPIEVDSLWTIPDQDWFGFGYVPLPFGNTLVKVEWQQVKIDQKGNICQGIVRGISDDPIYYPDLNPGPVAFGGEICVKPPSQPGFDTSGIHSVTGLPWDEYGFGPNGTYDKEPPYKGYKPGMPLDTTGMYDPWGFDADGNHRVTGKPTNEYGCTQEQMNSLLSNPPAAQDSPCDSLPPPYYWLAPGNPLTQAGLNLASQVEDSLEFWLGQILDEMLSFYQDSIDLQGPSCDSIRTVMNDLVTTLGYERKYLFGPDSLYFKQGMHEHFTAEPSPMGQTTARDANQVELESRHIDLYHCDKKLYRFVHYKEILQDLRNNGLSAFAAELLSLIQQFNEEQANYNAVHENLLQWLRKQSLDKIRNVYKGLYGYVPSSLTKDTQFAVHEPSGTKNGSGNYLAGHFTDDELNRAFLESLDLTPEDVSFQFRQGWREIGGIHRAYYLEAMTRQRQQHHLFKTPVLLTEHDSTLMPIVVTNRASDGRKYEIYLDSIVFTPQTAQMSAYLLLELPNNGQKIVFEAHGLNFTPTGFPHLPAKLSLGNDVNVRLSNAARLIVKGTDSTFVAFDCNGFAGIGIEAEVEICRDYVIPFDPATGALLPDPQRVSGHFQVFVPTWGEFYVELTMDPFVINGLEDVKWRIDTVALDFSETISPPGAPPVGYNTPFAGPNGFSPMWKGFYMKNFSATLGNQFTQTGQPLTVGVQKVVIDDNGFSGKIYAAPLLDLQQGNAGGWGFSVDTFGLTIIANDIAYAGFNGLVNVPIFKNAGGCSDTALVAADCFKYDGFIEPGNKYHFDIHMNGSYCVDMWQAGEVVLDSCSSVSMWLVDGEFTTLAKLHGKITVDANLGNGISLKAPNITFNNVEVSNKAPYFSPGHWSFPSIGVDFGGFGLAITKLDMNKTEDGDPSLSFGAEIELSEAVGLSASGGFKIIGELVTPGGRQRWKLKQLKVEQICLSGKKFPGVKRLSGCIAFYEGHQTYGTGFRGQVGVTFEGFEEGPAEISVDAIAQFGRVSGTKYFFIDALVCGLPLKIGPLDVYGLGGGVYHHMTRPDSGAGLPLCSNVAIPTTIGSSISGITYTPDASKGLGFKLTVVMALANERAFNANATFEILFNSQEAGGGLSDAWIYGNARMMEDMDLHGVPGMNENGPPPNTAAVKANIDLHMDFNEKYFLGKMDVYLNVGGVFRGAGPDNLMAHAEVSFKPGEWYIKVGEPWYGSGPDKRAGMVVDLPVIGTISDFRSYLQIGKNLDPMPPLPAHIAALTGTAQTGNFSGQLSSAAGAAALSQRSDFITNGDGFLFGSEINIGSHDFKFLIFNAALAAEMGFDISLLDYGSGASCSNTGNQLGINGWYASGQAWAGLDLGIGIRVKVFGKTKTFDIFDMAAAVALQAKLPNPFWMQGAAGADYNLLNGLVKGHCDFQFTIGELCQLTGASNPYEDVEIISMTTPSEGQKVSSQHNPKVSFNFPVGQPFSMPDFNGNNFEYHIKLDEAKILYYNYNVPLELEWAQGSKELTLKPKIYLPRNDTFQMIIKVHVDSNSVNIHEEERIVNFTTNGSYPTYILPANVAGSYPIDGQYNFYKKELTDHKGYILLKKGQPDLFFENNGFDMAVRFRKADGTCEAVPVSYDALSFKVMFDIPVNFLENGSVYRMELVRIPSASNGYSTNFCASLPPSQPGNTAQAAAVGSSQQIGVSHAGSSHSNNSSQSDPPNCQTLHTMTFRVSVYDKFYDKIGAWASSKTAKTTWGYKNNIEPFDQYELGLVPGRPALMDVRAKLNTYDTPWFNESAIQYMYNNLAPCESGICLESNSLIYGYPPDRAVFWRQIPGTTQVGISGNHFSGALPDYSSLEQTLRYAVTEEIESHHSKFRSMIYDVITGSTMDVATWVADATGQNVSSLTLSDLWNQYPQQFANLAPLEYFTFYFNYSTFPTPATGPYPVVFKYRPPGKAFDTSVREVSLYKN